MHTPMTSAIAFVWRCKRSLLVTTHKQVHGTYSSNKIYDPYSLWSTAFVHAYSHRPCSYFRGGSVLQAATPYRLVLHLSTPVCLVLASIIYEHPGNNIQDVPVKTSTGFDDINSTDTAGEIYQNQSAPIHSSTALSIIRRETMKHLEIASARQDHAQNKSRTMQLLDSTNQRRLFL